jgi:hypothetical protein
MRAAHTKKEAWLAGYAAAKAHAASAIQTYIDVLKEGSASSPEYATASFFLEGLGKCIAEREPYYGEIGMVAEQTAPTTEATIGVAPIAPLLPARRAPR